MGEENKKLKSIDDFLNETSQNNKLMSIEDFLANQKKIMPGQTNVTQKFDNYNPDLEIFSNDRSRDTNLSADMNTPVSLPPGQWQVEKVYNQAPAVGAPRDSTNQGYGNMIKARNSQTGESLLYEHLASVNAQQGQVVSGGVPIAQTGASGNATGPNLGIEYEDKTGKLGEVLNSPYAAYLPIIQ